jgi:hypothetical protein
MRHAAVLALLLCLALAACGSDESAAPSASDLASPVPVPVPVPSAEPSGLADLAPDEALTGEQLTGVLGGDAALEGGCTWLEVGGERYEVIYPEGYAATADPPQLTGPAGEVLAEAGDELTVTGTGDPDMATICQVGPVFAAETVEPTG